MEPRLIPTSARPAAARARIWRLQSDAVLCRAAAHGNELAYSELYRRHFPALRAFVFHLLGSRHRHEDADDVVQDAFARAFDALADQGFSGDFKRWLFTIARNRSVDLLRGERVRLVSLEGAVGEDGPWAAAEATSPATVAETRDEVAWLVAALEQLPERQRSALLLRELAGLSHEAIADELGTTTGSARQLITRAREGVRSAADRDGRDRDSLRSRSLRNELLEAAPMVPIVPLAAAGVVASAGGAAGGSIAAGKLLATVLAALVLAGAAGPISQEIADASGATRNSDAAPAAAASGASRSGADSGGDRVESTPAARLDDEARRKLNAYGDPGDARKGHDSIDSTSRGTETKEQATVDAPSGPQSVAPKPQPVNEIVELPGKVVERVADGLNGTSPPDQVVGDVLTDVTDTLESTTSGLLGSGSGSGSR